VGERGVITVVGHDGSPLSPAADAALRQATLVVGAQRHLDAVALPPGAQTLAMGDVRTAVDRLVAHAGDAVVLASGDPGLFGIVRTLRRAGAAPRVLPGTSSVAQAFARVGLPWDDAVVVSAHGRDPRPAIAAARAHRKVAVLTDASHGPAEVGRALAGSGRTVVVCERLATSAWCGPLPRTRPRARTGATPTSCSSLPTTPSARPAGSSAHPRHRPSGRCPTTPSTTGTEW
jgi:precorrin-6Y C5,15-methyltransferase (decarboxylating)